MYIWNNLFFSFACDSREHYMKYGGDDAAYAAATLDLKGVDMYNKLDLEGLYTLGTVVVDYRGYRIIAQSIIPGILQREQENSVVYGSVDGGKTIATHNIFLEKVIYFFSYSVNNILFPKYSDYNNVCLCTQYQHETLQECILRNW